MPRLVECARSGKIGCNQMNLMVFGPLVDQPLLIGCITVRVRYCASPLG